MEFAKNLKKIRNEKKLSLQELADLSSVSKSMLSKIEREEKNPTLQVASQIAEALNMTLSALLGEHDYTDAIIIKKEQRLVYIDAQTGFERHLLSPSFPSKGIEYILNIIPMGKESPIFPPHRKGVKEYIVLIKSRLQVILGEKSYELESGDSIYFEANIKHQFKNIGDSECQYYLIIDSHELKK